MGKGKIVAIIGAAIGIASVLLSLAIPAFFSWYRMELSGYGTTYGVYLTGFGTIVEDFPAYYPVPTDMITMVMIGGILVLAGAGLCIVGGATEMKVLGIIGGIVMIVGPTMLIFELMGEFSDFSEGLANMVDFYDKSIFFGSVSPAPGITRVWGLWVGYFIAYAGGVIGLIGGATT